MPYQKAERNKGLVIIYQGGWGGVIQNFKE